MIRGDGLVACGNGDGDGLGMDGDIAVCLARDDIEYCGREAVNIVHGGGSRCCSFPYEEIDIERNSGTGGTDGRGHGW